MGFTSYNCQIRLGFFEVTGLLSIMPTRQRQFSNTSQVLTVIKWLVVNNVSLSDLR